MTHRPDNPFRTADAPTPPPHEAAEDVQIVAAETGWELPPTPEFHVYGESIHPVTGQWTPPQYDRTREAFTGPGHDNGHGNSPSPDRPGVETFAFGLFPPTWPAWAAVETAKAKADALAETVAREVPTTSTDFPSPRDPDVRVRLEGHYDTSHPVARQWLEAVDEANRALAEATRQARAARSYKDPDTGLGYLTLIHQARDRERISDVVEATRQWEAVQALTSRPVPSLDDMDATTAWAMADLLPDGGAAMVIGSAAAQGKEAVISALANAVATDEEFLGHAAATTDQVVVIDTDHAPAVLKETYASAWAYGAEILPFRGRAADLDVRIPAVRQWLARRLPARSIVIVDSLPTILGVLGIAEITADAGGYLAGWTALAAEADLAGVVMVHASPGTDASRPRGHGTIASWPDALWAVSTSRGKTTVAVTSASGTMKLALEKEPEDDDDDDDVPTGPNFGQPSVTPSSTPESTPSSQADGPILEAVTASPGMTATQVAQVVPFSPATVDRRLKKMEAAGLVTKTKGTGRAIHWWPAKK